MARPMLEPTIEASASGMSKTRWRPNFSIIPSVVRKTPPSRPTSRPSTMTRSSSSISLRMAARIASMIVSSATPRSSPSVPGPAQHLVALAGQPRVELGVDVVEDLGRLRRRRQLGLGERVLDLLGGRRLELPLPLLVPHPPLSEVELDPLDRVAQPRLPE